MGTKVAALSKKEWFSFSDLLDDPCTACTQETGHEDWQTQFFFCWEDIPACLLSFFCTPIQYGVSTQNADAGNCILCCCCYFWLGYCLCGFHPLLGGRLRRHTRKKYNIRGSWIWDCVIACCCPCCDVARNAREMLERKQDRFPDSVLSCKSEGSFI